MQKEQEEISQSTSAAEKTIEKLHSNNDSIKVCYISNIIRPDYYYSDFTVMF